MDTIQKVALIVHTLIALLIIALVLLQRGKGADAGAAFGAGADQVANGFVLRVGRLNRQQLASPMRSGSSDRIPFSISSSNSGIIFV